MIKAIKNYFKPAHDPSRRRFIRNAGALAALTVVATNLPGTADFIFSKEKALSDKIKSGLIEWETFYLSETLVIDIPNVTFRNCRFIALNPMPFALELGKNAINTRLDTCEFIGAGIKGYIYLN